MKFSKLGNGEKKYKFKFINKDNKRTSIKFVYADDIYKALDLFNEYYANYNVEIINAERVVE